MAGDLLILEAATGARPLTDEELQQVVDHVARAGFDPTIRAGRTAAMRHFSKHVEKQQEWPQGTTLELYLESIRTIVRDPYSGICVSRYQGAWQLGIVRRSGDFRGPRGFDWVLVEYRVEIGLWVTAYQAAEGLNELASPQRTEVRWLRRPR